MLCPAQQGCTRYDFGWEFGGPGSEPGQFSYPTGTCFNSAADLYVADTENHRVQLVNNTGSPMLSWGERGSDPGQFNHPSDVTVDPEGNVFVVDSGNNRIQKFTAQGDFILAWGSTGSLDGQFQNPLYIASDSEGSVYVSDYSNNRVTKFDNLGGFQWNRGATAPKGLAVDAGDIVYVLRYWESEIIRLDPDGSEVDRVNTGPANPWTGIEVGPAGCLYMGAVDSHSVYMFTPTGSFVRYLTIWDGGPVQGNVQDVAIQAPGWLAAVDGKRQLIHLRAIPPLQAELSTWGRIKALWR